MMKKVFELFGTTGFKSKCVTACYLMFWIVTLYFALFYAVGTFSSFTVNIQPLNEFYAKFITLDGVAILSCFGASFVESKFDKEHNQ